MEEGRNAGQLGNFGAQLLTVGSDGEFICRKDRLAYAKQGQQNQ
jgi:hypothetical protein